MGRWVLNRNFWCKCSQDIETDRKQWYISRYHAGFSSTILRGPCRSLNRAIRRNDFRVVDLAQNFKKSSAKFSYERAVETKTLSEKSSLSLQQEQKPSSAGIMTCRAVLGRTLDNHKAKLNFETAKTSELSTNLEYS